jgi:enoyl-CoA hydratase
MIDYHAERDVARITIRRADKKNALTAGMVRDLVRRVDDADMDDAVKVVILTGEGDTFCSGYDISDPVGFEGSERASRRERIADVGEKASWMRRLFLSRTPIVASVRGPCVGIGTYLALVSDFVVADGTASFGLPEERFGSAGTTWAYPFLILEVGLKRATEMVMTGRRYGADEAQAMGLVTRLVSNDDLDGSTDELARALASLPRDGVAVSRALREVALGMTGHVNAFALHPLAHPLTERMVREPDEFDFMATVEREGLRTAISERNERFGGSWWDW